MVAWIPAWLCNWVGGGFSIHYSSASPKLSLEFHCIKLQARNVHGVCWTLLSSLPIASNPEALETGFGPHRKPIRYKNSTEGQVVASRPPHRKGRSLPGSQNCPTPALLGPAGGMQGLVEGAR